jgi:hypothetical protein
MVNVRLQRDGFVRFVFELETSSFQGKFIGNRSTRRVIANGEAIGLLRQD